VYKLEKIINEYILDLLFDNNEGEKTIQYIDEKLLMLNECKVDSTKLLKYSNDELFKLIDRLKLSNESRIKAKLIDCRSLKGKFFKYINAINKRSWINDFLDDLVEILYKELIILKKETLDKIAYNKLAIANAYDIYSNITYKEKKEISDLFTLKIILNNTKIDDSLKDEIYQEVINMNNNIKKEEEKKKNIPLSLLTKEELERYKKIVNLVKLKKSELQITLEQNKGNIIFEKYLYYLVAQIEELSNIINEIDASLNLYDECVDYKDKQTLIAEKDNNLTLLKNAYEEYLELQQEFLLTLEQGNDKVYTGKKPNIIYLTTGHKGEGNVCFESYLKNIPLEYYDTLLEMLVSLEEGVEFKNPVKNKSLTAILAGYWERKEFKLRILYEKIYNDDILIILCDQKKSNETLGTNRYRQTINNCKKEIDYIKNTMASESKEREELITINKEIHENIKSKLQEKGRKRK